MDPTATPTHRTIALVGGAGSGKTTLAEALLLRAGAIQRKGVVEQGTTVCDHDPEEIARQTTLGISLAYLTWTGEDGGGVRDDARRHARPPRLRGRCRHRAGGGGCRRRRGQRGRRRDAGDPCGVGRGRAGGRPAHRDRDAGGPGTRGLPPRAGGASRRVRRAPVAARAAPRRGAGLPRASPTCSASTRSSTTMPATTARRRCPPVPQAEEHDLHVSVTEDIVSHDDAQLEAYLDGNEPSAGELERTLATRGRGRRGRPGAAVLGGDRHRRRPHRRSAVRTRAAARSITTAGSSSARTRRGRAAPRCGSRRTPTARRSSTCSAPSPTRSSARSRCSRCCRARCGRATGCATRPRVRRSGCRHSSGCAELSMCPPTRCAPARWARSRS